MQFVYSLFLAVWRRWFGGGLDFLPDNRFFKHVVGFLAVACLLLFNGYHWLQIDLAGAALQGLFWARSHGDYFKVTYTGKDGYYNFKGNVTGLFLRYEPASILIACILQNWWFLFAGVAVTASYAIMGKLFPNKSYTEYAEYLAGFSVGLLLGV